MSLLLAERLAIYCRYPDFSGRVVFSIDPELIAPTDEHRTMLARLVESRQKDLDAMRTASGKPIRLEAVIGTDELPRGELLRIGLRQEFVEQGGAPEAADEGSRITQRRGANGKSVAVVPPDVRSTSDVAQQVPRARSLGRPLLGLLGMLLLLLGVGAVAHFAGGGRSCGDPKYPPLPLLSRCAVIQRPAQCSDTPGCRPAAECVQHGEATGSVPCATLTTRASCSAHVACFWLSCTGEPSKACSDYSGSQCPSPLCESSR
jgi:hypothetical protein